MSRGESEPMRLTNEWAGKVLVPPEVAALYPPGTAVGRAESDGMTLLPEVRADLRNAPVPAHNPSDGSSPPPPAIVAGLDALIRELPEPTRDILGLRLSGRTTDQIAGQLQ